MWSNPRVLLIQKSGGSPSTKISTNSGWWTTHLVRVYDLVFWKYLQSEIWCLSDFLPTKIAIKRWVPPMFRSQTENHIGGYISHSVQSLGTKTPLLNYAHPNVTLCLVRNPYKSVVNPNFRSLNLHTPNNSHHISLPPTSHTLINHGFSMG